MSVVLFPTNHNHRSILKSIEPELRDASIELKWLTINPKLYFEEDQTSLLDFDYDKIIQSKSKWSSKILHIINFWKSKSKFKKLISAKKAIIVGNDSNFLIKPYLILAQKMGLKIILIQDGNYNGLQNNVHNSFFKGLASLFIRSFLTEKQGSIADLVLVYGNKSKNILDDFNERGRIVVTGSPKHAKLRRAYENAVKNYVKTSQKNILFCTSNYANSYLPECEQAQRRILERCAKSVLYENVNLVIRHHPREDVRVYHSLLVEEKISISLNGNILDDLLTADVVFTCGSTVLFESELCGVPCYQLLPDNSLKKYEISGFRVVNDMNEMDSLIKELAQKGKLQSSRFENASEELFDFKDGVDSVDLSVQSIAAEL